MLECRLILRSMLGRQSNGQHGRTVLTSQNYHLTALYWAAWYNSTDVIEVLLKHRASTSIKDGEGRTPIDDARGWNKETAVRLLERH